MPIPIKFGTKEETLPKSENAKEDEKPKTIVVDNIIPSTQVTQIPQESGTKLIVLGKSLNSMVKENILLDAAYT